MINLTDFLIYYFAIYILNHTNVMFNPKVLKMLQYTDHLHRQILGSEKRYSLYVSLWI